MNIGLLWFDHSERRDFATKLERAAAYYCQKYGEPPTLCFVHPTMVRDGVPPVEGIEIRVVDTVLPDHFWLGSLERVA